MGKKNKKAKLPSITCEQKTQVETAITAWLASPRDCYTVEETPVKWCTLPGRPVTGFKWDSETGTWSVWAMVPGGSIQFTNKPNEGGHVFDCVLKGVEDALLVERKG